MSNRKSTTTAASELAAITPTNSTIVLPEPTRRALQNFLLIWLDANLNESNEDFKKSLQKIQYLVASIKTFTDAEECIDFLSASKKEKVFMIVSGSLGQHVIPKIHALPQLDSIYVFCSNQSIHEEWARTMPKVKGVHTTIESICEALQIDRKNSDRAMISISYNGIDILFTYAQILKETLLQIEDDDTKSLKEFVDYCRLQGGINEDEINKVELEYHRYTPIWWYTAPYFMRSMLKRGFQLMDVDIIVRMNFFIRHLHQHIKNLHRDQQPFANTSPFQLFRGQGLAVESFDKLKKTKSGLMSFNSFLPASRNRSISLENFARPAALANDPNLVGVLFVMIIDPKLCAMSSIPFVDVKNVGFFKGKEGEILFSTHTIFRIDKIQRIYDVHTDRLYQVNLTLTGNDNHEINTFTAHIRKEINLKALRGWSQLGFILIKLGEPAKAERLYQILLEKASSDVDRAYYNHLLGSMYDDMGEYKKALSFFKKAHEINRKTLPPSHPDIVQSQRNVDNMKKKL
ncbi:unnamed protein product [Rotaria sp. Silwood1]|nr:unnamed protein product [Rotaria sp. Silwood1]CAF3734530.1 unnamed protein product [Rotaria sp. Silwood1]